MKIVLTSAALIILAGAGAQAQQVDLSALHGDLGTLGISGVSSGAAMAVQYAVAHSDEVMGVGAIAGPPWHCAEGSVLTAIRDCMCGGTDAGPEAKLAEVQSLAAQGLIAILDAHGKPVRLDRAWVFHSPVDRTVVKHSGEISAEFLSRLLGKPVPVDTGSDGGAAAGHGMISPDGEDACQANGKESTYVRKCGAEDNAGRLFHALYGAPGTSFDPTRRKPAQAKPQPFNQQKYIDEVKATGVKVAPDEQFLFTPFVYRSEERYNLDMAKTGYVYVPPACTVAGANCAVHVALHGCKQDGETFSRTAGYNPWADVYKVIVVYPATTPRAAKPEEGICQVPVLVDGPSEPNPNGCWDWWGYLDDTPADNRYVTRNAPQMQVIERIVADVGGKRLSSSHR